MTIAESGPGLGATSAVDHDGHPRLAWAARRISAAANAVRASAITLARHAPATIRATRLGAQETTSALQTLPDTTLRSLAASSLGLGAGFYMARASRLAVAAGLAPAVVLGAAVLLRPIRRTDGPAEAPDRLHERRLYGAASH